LQQAEEFKLNSIKEYCLKFIVKDINYREVVMSPQFEDLAKPLMVEVIRRREQPQTTSLPDHASAIHLDVGTSLETDLKSFLTEGIGDPFSDIVLVVDGSRIQAHKAILAARCSYFEAMFRSFMPEKNEVTISIGETVPSLQAFESLMKYIYYGDVNMSPEDSLYVFAAPQYYGFTNGRLQVFCKQHLAKISPRNVVQILEAADKIEAGDMKQHALNIIVQHFPQVARMPRIRDLPRHLLLDMLDAVADHMSVNGTVDSTLRNV
jgi:hypothetical protein